MNEAKNRIVIIGHVGAGRTEIISGIADKLHKEVDFINIEDISERGINTREATLPEPFIIKAPLLSDDFSISPPKCGKQRRRIRRKKQRKNKK
tara:strand:+ start:1492 stop:1770 length:279 start_codon:yes stop_codon:yes gene_type:complete